jgi:hypothetical protein
MSPNPLMFWSLVTNGGQILSMCDTYCGETATDLRDSVASFFRKSYEDNCGTFDEMIEDTAKLSAIIVNADSKAPKKKEKTSMTSLVDSGLNGKRPRGVGKPKKYGFDDDGEGAIVTKKSKKGATTVADEIYPGVSPDNLESPVKTHPRNRGSSKTPKDSTKTAKEKTARTKKTLNAVVPAAYPEEPPSWVAQLLQGLATPSAKYVLEKNQTSYIEEKKKKKKKKRRDIFSEVAENMKKSYSLNLMGLEYNAKLQSKQQKSKNRFELTHTAHNSQMRAFERNELLLDTQARAQANWMYAYKPPQTLPDMMAFSSKVKKSTKKKKTATESSSSKSTTSEVNLSTSSSTFATVPKNMLIDSESEESSSESDSDDTGDDAGSEDTEDDDEEDSSSEEDDSDNE